MLSGAGGSDRDPTHPAMKITATAGVSHVSPILRRRGNSRKSPLLTYFPTTRTTKLSGSIGGRGRGLSVVAAGRGPKSAVTTKTL